MRSVVIVILKIELFKLFQEIRSLSFVVLVFEKNLFCSSIDGCWIRQWKLPPALACLNWSLGRLSFLLDWALGFDGTLTTTASLTFLFDSTTRFKMAYGQDGSKKYVQRVVY